MDRMLVVVFDTENKAYEGEKALLQLEREGSLSVYAHAVLAKKADGTAVVLQGDDSGPIGTLLGTTWGAFIGLLGGPVGVAVGAGAGLVAGSDVTRLSFSSRLLHPSDVLRRVPPNRVR